MGGGTVIGFAYLILLRIPGVIDVMIWGIIAAIGFMIFSGGVVAWATAEEWAASTECEGGPCRSAGEIDTMGGVAKFFAFSTALYVCLVICVRGRILLGLAIVKEAARALGTMWLLVIFPVFQCVGLIIFLLPWLTYMVFLASSGEIVL